ncbi:hypothetical protein, partial [Actinomadura sp. SCN-SB]|uniref:hypothetical protein n=1 Tax=Actinomadura sp. SCN-SB TaxID=3373092 RepID=UPI003752F1D1
LLATLQSADREMAEIFDYGQPRETALVGSPQTTLLPGRKVAWNIGFSVDDPDDMILEITPDPEIGGVIYGS